MRVLLFSICNKAIGASHAVIAKRSIDVSGDVTGSNCEYTWKVLRAASFFFARRKPGLKAIADKFEDKPDLGRRFEDCELVLLRSLVGPVCVSSTVRGDGRGFRY